MRKSFLLSYKVPQNIVEFYSLTWKKGELPYWLQDVRPEEGFGLILWIYALGSAKAGRDSRRRGIPPVPSQEGISHHVRLNGLVDG